MLVANSYTGELFPVDAWVVGRVLGFYADPTDVPIYAFSRRVQTIYDLLMAGF